jgi:hypothetical protein
MTQSCSELGFDSVETFGDRIFSTTVSAITRSEINSVIKK